jgi:alanyl-tRNA synthetase
LDAEATALWHQAAKVKELRVVKTCFAGRTPEDLKHLAQRLVIYPKTVALLAGGGEAGEKGHFTFACSSGLNLHMGTLVRQACEDIGGGGGGRPQFAQGGGPQGDRVALALDKVLLSLVESIPDQDA